MNTEALKQVIRVLRQVQQEKLVSNFHLLDWFDHNASDQFYSVMAQMAKDAEELGESLISIPHRCGTTACAMGYAGLDPWFRSRGLKTDVTNGSLSLYDTTNGTVAIDDGWISVQEFLGLNGKQAEQVFSYQSYKDEEGKIIPLPTIDAIVGRIVGLIQTVEPEYQA